MFKNYLKEYLIDHSLDDLTSEFGIKYSIFNTNKKHDLVIFSYSQIDSPKTNKIVRMSRGIVLEKDTWEIVNFPFYRFFNFEEVPEERENFNWDHAVSTEKVDGSLMSYFFYDGDWYMSSRSVIGGENRITSDLFSFKDLFLKAISPLTEKEFQNELCLGGKIVPGIFSYIFELVSPFNRIVTPYDETKLYFIGCRNLKNNCIELSLPEIKHMYENTKINEIIKYPKIISLIDENGHFRGFEEMKKLSESVNATDEGFVVTDFSTHMNDTNSFPRTKVKNSSYVALHHLRSSIEGDEGGVTYYKIFNIIYKNEQDEFLAVLPQYKEVFDKVQIIYDKFKSYMDEVVHDEKFINFMKISKTSEKSKYQKEFALLVKDKKMANIFFLMYNKGYATYQDVINSNNSLDTFFRKVIEIFK